MTLEDFKNKCQALELLMKKNIITKQEYDGFVECLKQWSGITNDSGLKEKKKWALPRYASTSMFVEDNEFSFKLISCEWFENSPFFDINFLIKNNTDYNMRMKDCSVVVNDVKLSTPFIDKWISPKGTSLCKITVYTDDLVALKIKSRIDIRELKLTEFNFSIGNKQSYYNDYDIVISKYDIKEKSNLF